MGLQIQRANYKVLLRFLTAGQGVGAPNPQVVQGPIMLSPIPCVDFSLCWQCPLMIKSF